MNLFDARKVLGLDPEEDATPHFDDFEQARARIQELIRTSPNETLTARYQQGLSEFDEALAIVRDGKISPVRELAPTQKLPSETPPPVPEFAKIASPSTPLPPPSPISEPHQSRSSMKTFLVLLLLAALGGGGWYFYQQQQTANLKRQEQLVDLNNQAVNFLQNKQWLEASRIYDEIQKLAPDSQILIEGRRSLEAGLQKEQAEFSSSRNAQARADLAAGKWTEAETAVREVISKYPSEKEAPQILVEIQTARTAQQRQLALASVQEFVGDRAWDNADEALKKLREIVPNDPLLADFEKQISEGKAKTAADQTRALELLKQAQSLDNGSSNPQALAFLREAILLYPGHEEITATLNKIAAYGRTLNVPGDFSTLAEAIADSHDNDRIVLAEGIWKGPISVKTSIEIQGAGFGKTTVECPAEEGCALSVAAGKVRISGITFRQQTFSEGHERYSAALVQNGSATFDNCRFSDASGHGLIVVNGANASATRCRFSNNGWNGAAAFGKGSFLELDECESVHNYQHGIEAWDGSALKITASQVQNNLLNGIHVVDADAAITLEGNKLISNGEFGLVIDSVSSGTVSGNFVRSNALGGIVVRLTAGAVAVLKNEITQNAGAGLILEKGLTPDIYQNNKLEGNQGPALLSGADLNTNAPGN